ncbi:MAG: cysteine--tRNA ligase [Pseudomonadota bacterium]
MTTPPLTLYNSLTRAKDVFTPIDPDHVRLYACGPTVYATAHIGNARMAVVFDLLVRVLRHIYPHVTYVSNITDVDDKIMDAAAETGRDISDITAFYTEVYNADMAALGNAQPDIQPRATAHIPEMIAMITALIDHDHAYAVDGHVLFNVPSYPDYGRLSGRNRDDQIAGARVEVAPYKRDPADFILWKPSSSDQPGWDSPWGRGRPGWHIECSAMAARHLGLPFDIHGGGVDLKFPHHENEIAQACCAHHTPRDAADFARVWVHNGFLTVGGEKMSKSLNNFITAHALLEGGMKGEVIRLALLGAHYRQPSDWSDDSVHQAQKMLDKLYTVLQRAPGDHAVPTSADPELVAALCDDLNTPQAIAVLHRLIDAARQDDAHMSVLKASCDLMGLGQHDPATWFATPEIGDALVAQIERLIAARETARKARDFAQADTLRQELTALGVTLEDTSEGPKWRPNNT